MQMQQGSRWLADLALVTVAVVWGSNNVIVKAALPGWQPLSFASVRFVLGAAALIGLMLLVEDDWRLPRQLWWKVATLGVIGNAVNQVLYIYGVKWTSASNAGIMGAMLPVFVAVSAALTGLDQPTRRLWVGSVISFSGILLVTMSQGFAGFRLGDLLLLGASLAWAGYTLFANPLSKQASPLKVSAYAMACAAAVLLGIGAPDLVRQDWSAIALGSWAGVFYAGVVSNGVGFGLYVWAIRRIGSTRASVFNNLNPIVTAAGAWIFLGERWTGWQWLGAFLVMAGVLTARWDALSAGLRKGVSEHGV